MRERISKAPPYITAEWEVALDALVAVTGVRLERHQLEGVARIRAMSVVPLGAWTSPERAFWYRLNRWHAWSGTRTWLEVLRVAYATAKGRRRSRAQRRGKECGRVRLERTQGPEWHPWGSAAHLRTNPQFVRGRCRRELGHDGFCEL